MAEFYKVNGAFLTNYLAHIQTLDGVLGVPPLRQSDYVVPGRTGNVAAKPWVGARPITFGGIVCGSDRANYLDNLRKLGKQCFNSGDPLVIERTIDLPDGSTLTTQATARYVGGLETAEQLAHHTGRVAIEFSLLDGYFFDVDYTDLGATTSASFGVTVPGEAATHEVRVRFAGGSGAQKLTNTTTSDYVQYTGSTTPSVLIDSAKFTAVQDGSNVIANVRSGTESYYFLRLAPGPNLLTLESNGSARIQYKAAYL